MTKRNAEMFMYDPEKTYDIADFANTTIKNLYAIGKQVGLRDVKKPKKDELARLILAKHVETPISQMVNSVVNDVLDDIFKHDEVFNIQEEIHPSAQAYKGIAVFGDLMNQILNDVPFYTIDSTQWFHANSISKYLQYLNYSDAIYRHVSDCNKLSFQSLKMKLNTCLYLIQYQPETIFINENGVIELIKKSNLPKATGKCKREIEEVYVATTAVYEKDKIYKIGKSYNSKKRIDNMNTGRIPSDEMYLCYVGECSDALKAESYIHTVLKEYRVSNKREFFKLDIDEIIKTVDTVCSMYC